MNGHIIMTKSFERNLLILSDGSCLLDFRDEETFAKFDPQWLSLCDSIFLEQLAADALLKKEINRQMQEAYERGKLDEKLVGGVF